MIYSQRRNRVAQIISWKITIQQIITQVRIISIIGKDVPDIKIEADKNSC